MATTQDPNPSPSQANSMPNNPPNSSPSSISLLEDATPPPYDYQDHDSIEAVSYYSYYSSSTEHKFVLPPIPTKMPGKKWWRRNWLKKGWRKLEKGAAKFNEIVLYAIAGADIREALQRMRRKDWERKQRRA